jgi:hypothetical protein
MTSAECERRIFVPVNKVEVSRCLCSFSAHSLAAFPSAVFIKIDTTDGGKGMGLIRSSSGEPSPQKEVCCRGAALLPWADNRQLSSMSTAMEMAKIVCFTPAPYAKLRQTANSVEYCSPSISLSQIGSSSFSSWAEALYQAMVRHPRIHLQGTAPRLPNPRSIEGGICRSRS